MLAFGIDPGSLKTGWGVLSIEGSRARMVDCGVIMAPSSRELPARLAIISEELGQLLERHRPDGAFLESIFHAKSARSALILGHARGVAMLACERAGLSVLEISPSEVKKAVSGSGRAEKSQVAEMIRVLLGLPQVAQEDASDALAVAFAGATRTRFANTLAASVVASKARGRRRR